MDALELLADVRVMPVVVIDDADLAVPLAATLRDAGVGAIEITLRTPAALDAIRRVAREVPDIIAGAGSVRRPAQFDELRAIGARFAVSPGATPALLGAARSAGMAYLPGAASASEMLQHLEAGYALQKFFPAELLGGAAMLKALSAPLPELRFCPTGGLKADNLTAYLDLPCVACVGGSWFIPADALQQRDFQRIGRLAAEAVALTRSP